MSYVNPQGDHGYLNHESIKAFRLVAKLIKDSIPVILESMPAIWEPPINFELIDNEVSAAMSVFSYC